MRVTNKIMQNNTLYNINQNKVTQNQLQNQISTRKKITKPSDDPVIAIRALRLRSNLNQITQYYDRNIPDAQEWLNITEASVNSTIDVIGGMIDECRRGSKSSLVTSDRSTILESLKQLRDEVYATGDSDYAGRTIFTGYRTDMKLSFQDYDPKDKLYSITEQLTNKVVDTFTYVNTQDLGTINESNFATISTTEQDVVSSKVYRIRLAYDNLESGTTPEINTVDFDANGNPTPTTLFTPTTVSINSNPSPYALVSDPNTAGYNAYAVIFIPETGELVLGENAYNDIMTLSADKEITVTYEKDQWVSGDLRPEHYFACESDGIKYNESYLNENGRDNKQVIEYDVGFNQQIEINTTADEIFVHAIGRTVDEMIGMLTEIDNIERVIDKLEKMQKDSSYSDAQQKTIQTELDAANKSKAYLVENAQRRFEKGITDFQNHLDNANTALTAIGNRSLRLELVENRLNAQKMSFEELTSENEDADLEDLAVQLKSANLTYDAALAATGKMLTTTLLNYI